MTKHDAKKFMEYMAMLNEMYGDGAKTISDLKMGIYFEALKEMSIDEVHEAIAKLAKTRVFKTFPTPAEILGAVRSSVEDRALLAFQDLIQLVQNGSGYSSVIFEDGTIGKVVEAMGGYERVCDWKTDDRRFNEMEFVKLYKVFDSRGPWPPVKFVGILEHENAMKGYLDHIPEPVRIGKQDIKAIKGARL
jgi:hypothetical protein